MEAFLTRICGFDDALIALKMSKQNVNYEEAHEIMDHVAFNSDVYGNFFKDTDSNFESQVKTLLKWGQKHITLLKFVDLTFVVFGLHRGAQDDLDSHAKRMDNRIIRSSTRVNGCKNADKVSEWFEGKIYPTDQALDKAGIGTPENILLDGKIYVKTTNGYIDKELSDDQDVKRGLYMLSIPSNCIFKINLAEFAHIYRLRNENTAAHPELKKCIEMMANELSVATNGWVSRQFLLGVEN